MKNFAPYFKWFVILVIAIFLFISFRGCNCTGSKQIGKTDTLSVTHEVVIHKVDTVTQIKPMPYKVKIHDTLETDGPLAYYPIDQYPSAIQKMLTEYNASKFYRDSLQLKYGKVYVTDTLRWNRITGQSITANLSIPETTNTVTIQTEAPKRIIAYFGAELVGNPGTPFYMAGINGGLLMKNQKYYGIGAFLDKNGNVWYKGELKIPIRLRK